MRGLGLQPIDLEWKSANLDQSISDRSAAPVIAAKRYPQLWAAVVERHPDAGFQRVDDRLLVAGPDDFLHTFEDECGELSDVGERIVELADGTRTVAQIADVLCGEFEVEPDQCRADTVEFIRLLVDRHLLVLR